MTVLVQQEIVILKNEEKVRLRVKIIVEICIEVIFIRLNLLSEIKRDELMEMGEDH